MRWKGWFRKNGKDEVPDIRYDPETQKPAIRASICTGERVAGFRSKNGDAFQEVMLIRSDQDLEAFRKAYGITGEIETFY